MLSGKFWVQKSSPKKEEESKDYDNSKHGDNGGDILVMHLLEKRQNQSLVLTMSGVDDERHWQGFWIRQLDSVASVLDTINTHGTAMQTSRKRTEIWTKWTQSVATLSVFICIFNIEHKRARTQNFWLLRIMEHVISPKDTIMWCNPAGFWWDHSHFYRKFW